MGPHPASRNPLGRAKRLTKESPLHRHRALAVGVLLSAVLLLPSARAEASRERGIALPPDAPVRREMLSSERRPSPTPGPTTIRLAVADPLLVPPLPPGLTFGATWVDLDGDGDLDLTIPVDRIEPPSLLVYRNDRGVF